MRGKIRHLTWLADGAILLFATVVVAIAVAVAATVLVVLVAGAHALLFLTHTALRCTIRGACAGSPGVKLSTRHRRPSPSPGAAAREPSPDKPRDGLFLLMGLLAGGLGYAVSRQPLSRLFSTIWANGDIRTFVCAVVFVIVFIILGQYPHLRLRQTRARTSHRASATLHSLPLSVADANTQHTSPIRLKRPSGHILPNSLSAITMVSILRL